MKHSESLEKVHLILRWFCLVSFIASPLCLHSFANGSAARLVRSDQANVINKLIFDKTEDLDVLSGLSCKSPVMPEGGTCVIVNGQFDQQNATIYFVTPKGRLPLVKAGNTNRRFQVKIPVESKAAWVRFMSKNDNGEKVKENIKMFIRGSELSVANGGSFTSSASYLAPSLLFASSTFTQSGKTKKSDTDFSSLVAQVDFEQKLDRKNRFSLGLNLASTLVALSTSRTDGISTGYLRGFWSAIFQAFPESSKFNVDLYGGMFYHSMRVTGDAFGFNHILGPQVGTRLKAKFSQKFKVNFGLRYSIVAGDFLPSSASNAEFQLGSGLEWTFTKRHGLYLNYDFSSANYELISGAGKTIEIHLGTHAMGMGYRLYL